MMVLGGGVVSYERGTPVVMIVKEAEWPRRDSIQGYRTHKKPPTPYDPTVALCLGPFVGPKWRG